MREIEFRGKRTNGGEWAYGFLDHTYDRYTIHSHGAHYCYEVHPETVGQYTGLKDRNGVRIFEGDVIDWRYIKNKGDIWKKHELVVFENGYFFIKTITEFFFTPGLEPSGTSLYNEAAVFERALIENPKGNYFYKVIGNIHDNPELLEAVQ